MRRAGSASRRRISTGSRSRSAGTSGRRPFYVLNRRTGSSLYPPNDPVILEYSGRSYAGIRRVIEVDVHVAARLPRRVPAPGAGAHEARHPGDRAGDPLVADADAQLEELALRRARGGVPGAVPGPADLRRRARVHARTRLSTARPAHPPLVSQRERRGAPLPAQVPAHGDRERGAERGAGRG